MKCKALRDIWDEYEGFITIKGRLYNVLEHDRKNKLIKIDSELGSYWLQSYYLKIM